MYIYSRIARLSGDSLAIFDLFLPIYLYTYIYIYLSHYSWYSILPYWDFLNDER